MRPSPLPLLAEAGVRLVPSGADRWRCRCPVHQGDGLSLSVRCVKGDWRLTCFACGFSGSGVDLWLALRGGTLRDALRAMGSRQRGADGQLAPPPVQLHKRPALVLACSHAGCGAVLEAEGRTYKCPGTSGGLWETTAAEEMAFAADRAGWEVSADMDAGAVCADCLDRAAGLEPAPVRIVIAFDGDAAGDAAIRRLVDKAIDAINDAR